MRSVSLRVLAFIFLFLTSATVSRASRVIWEDFNDGNGNGAFDPDFVHTIGLALGSGPAYWEWADNTISGSPASPSLWLDDNVQDYVMFRTGVDEYVSDLSVSYGPYASGIEVIGENGTKNYGFVLERWTWETINVDQSTIGPIQAVRLVGGAFDDIVVTIVPEPNSLFLFVSGLISVALVSLKAHRKIRGVP